MSSSTSSSNEWRVVLTLIACLLATELAMRVAEPHLSKDLAHIRSLPAIADAMRTHAGHKVLVMGNSLTRSAIDMDRLVTAFNPATKPAVFTFIADASSAVNWDYGLRRYFLNTGARPDVLLLGTGPLHLRDMGGDASRLGAYYVASSDLRRALHDDLPTWDEKCEFMLSRISVIHATRARIKPHVFGRLIPHYFDIEQWINTQRDVARQRTGQAPVDRATYHHLVRLLQDCAEAKVRVIIFSVPLPEPYQISNTTIHEIEASGASWLPLSDIPGLSKANFPDGYHLNAAGGQIFTQHLMGSLTTP